MTMLVVTIRKAGEQYAFGHIVDSGCTTAFCGSSVPSVVQEMGMHDPGNPYVGKIPASCTECLSEYHNGRREGFRTADPVVSNQEGE